MTEKRIARYFQEDHARLDGLFRTYQTLKQSAWARAAEAFQAFKWGLERHIVWEEELLFPFFESKTGMRDSGPTAVMRMEHREIRGILKTIQEKIENQDIKTAEEESSLLNVLGAHNQKEESILYPMMDRAARDEERRAIFEEMEKYPAQTS